MKTALVHDWLLSHGGAEEILKLIFQLYPGDIYTLMAEKAVVESYKLDPSRIHSSMIANLPFVKRCFKHYLPLFPYAIEQFDLSEYDLIISASHCVAKGVLTSEDQLHICYCHTPMRYAWDMYHEYLKSVNLTYNLKGMLARLFLHRLRLWDVVSAPRVDYFIANSHYVARRIQKIYGREATVIHCGVDTDQFAFSEKKEDFYLTASRLVPYKKIDLIVDAFNEMPSKKLYVIGSGEDLKFIKRKAKENVTVLGFTPTEQLITYLQRAKGFLFAALEDFGLLPVEAQSCGTPVLCLGKGGTKETVIDGKTGVHFHEQSVRAIKEAVHRFETMTFDPYTIREHALTFSKTQFLKAFQEFVHTRYEQFLGTHHRSFSK